MQLFEEDAEETGVLRDEPAEETEANGEMNDREITICKWTQALHYFIEMNLTKGAACKLANVSDAGFNT